LYESVAMAFLTPLSGVFPLSIEQPVVKELFSKKKKRREGERNANDANRRVRVFK